MYNKNILCIEVLINECKEIGDSHSAGVFTCCP